MSILKQITSSYSYPEKLKIKDLSRVSNMIDALVEKGPNVFQVIADFDFTLSKWKLPNGQRGASSPGVMTNSPLMKEDFGIGAKALHSKFHPIEVDPKLTIEEKIPFMVEWYEKRKDLIVASKFHKSLIPKMVSDSSVVLRDGVGTFLSKLNDAKVPLLIFSAGSGNILEEVLRRDKVYLPNIFVISNFLDFDENGFCTGYRNKTLIHVYNKNGEAMKDSTYFLDNSDRNNAILLGDSLGDVTMSVGMQNPETVLKIGFLNDNIEENLETFTASYDVVLLDDQTFEFINILQHFILNGASSPSSPTNTNCGCCLRQDKECLH